MHLGLGFGGDWQVCRLRCLATLPAFGFAGFPAEMNETHKRIIDVRTRTHKQIHRHIDAMPINMDHHSSLYAEGLSLLALAQALDEVGICSVCGLPLASQSIPRTSQALGTVQTRNMVWRFCPVQSVCSLVGLASAGLEVAQIWQWDDNFDNFLKPCM